MFAIKRLGLGLGARVQTQRTASLLRPSTATISMNLQGMHQSTAAEARNENPPFKKIMAANRGEIATRIMRAGACCTEC
jgi:hypothetical protein